MPSITRQRVTKSKRKASSTHGRQRYHEARAASNKLRRLQKSFRIPQEITIKRALLKGMTNWQNSQWLRAGRSESLKMIRRFALMPRRAA